MMIKELGKTFLIYGIASSISKFIGVFMVPIYTRVFSPADYGVIDLISIVISLASIVGMLQIESAISRYYYEIKNEVERIKYISTAFWTILIFSIIILIIVYISAGLISRLLFNSIKYNTVIYLAVFIIPVSNLFAFFSVIIRFQKKPLQYIVFVTIQLVLTVSVSIWLVVYEKIGIIGAFYGQMIGFSASALAMLIYLKKVVSFTFDYDILKKLYKYSLPLVPAVGGSWINSYANRFVMLGYLSITDIGLYTIALKIASIFKIGESAFRMAWGPLLWETIGNLRHRETLKEIAKLVTYIIFSIVIIAAFFSKDALYFLTTKEYYKAAPLIGILCFSLGLTIMVQTIGLGPSIVKKTIYNTIIYFMSISVNVASLFVFVPAFGIIGVAFSLFLSSFSLYVLAWYNSERLYYIGFDKLPFIVSFIITILFVGWSTFFDINLVLKFILSLMIIFINIIYVMKKFGRSILVKQKGKL